MFVMPNKCRNIYNYYFFNNKELLKGNTLERLVYLTLQLFGNSKGNSAYKNIFEMPTEKNFVAPSVECVLVTPAQNRLLKLITHLEAADHFKSLKQIHHLATYCVDKDMMELWHHGYVNNLLDAIQEIKQEHVIIKLNE